MCNFALDFTRKSRSVISSSSRKEPEKFNDVLGEYNGFTFLAWAVNRICTSRLFSGPLTGDVVYGATLLLLMLNGVRES